MYLPESEEGAGIRYLQQKSKKQRGLTALFRLITERDLFASFLDHISGINPRLTV
jgi:hypothetical protein